MPTLLYILRVDEAANEVVNQSSTQGDSFGANADRMTKLIGGMDWGVVTVWSCPRSCEQSTEEVVFVQAPVDHIS